MKKIIFLFSFLLFAVCSQAQFRLAVSGTPSWANLGGGQYSATVSLHADLTGNSYAVAGIADTMQLFTSRGQLFDLVSVADKTFSSATLTVDYVSGTNSAPVGQCMVFTPNLSGLIPDVPFGSAGATAQFNQMPVTYNAAVNAATPTASNGIRKVGNDFRWGNPTMLNQPGIFTSNRKNNLGAFKHYYGSNTDSTMFVINGATGNSAFGGETVAANRLTIVGKGTTSSTFGLRVQKSTAADVFAVRDDGRVLMGIDPTATVNSQTLTVANSTDGVTAFEVGRVSGSTMLSNRFFRIDTRGGITSRISDGGSYSFSSGLTLTSGYVMSANRSFFQSNFDVTPPSETGSWRLPHWELTGTVNMTSAPTSIFSGIRIDHTFSGSTNYRALSISTNVAGARGLYQSGTSMVNNLAGKTAIGSITAPTVTLEAIGTDAVKIPVGTTVERPVSPAAGYTRYNSDLDQVESWNAFYEIWVTH